jgi:hypothetical protein
MKSHKYKNGGRLTNPYTILFSTIIFCIWLISNPGYDDVYVKEADVFMKPVVVEVVKPKVTTTDKTTIEAKIRHYFPRNADVMVAIAKAESHLSMEAKNYNCWYDKNGNISNIYIKGGGRSCNIADREHAFGVDCFVLQAHYPGRKTCPKNVTIDQHLKEMADLSRQRSFQPWVVYNTGAYKVHLAEK